MYIFDQMTYQIAADLVYKFVCAEGLGQTDPIVVEYEGEIWQVYNYHDGKDGSSPSVVLSKETEGWIFYSTFYYCRYAKKITGFQHEGWEQED